MSIVGIVYIVLALIFGLIFLAEAIHYRRELVPYQKYGLVAAVALIGLDTSLLFMIPNPLSPFMLGVIVGGDLGALIRMLLYTCVGMICCTALDIYDMPVLRKLFHESRPLPRIEPGKAVTAVLATVVVAVIYSFALFTIMKPHMSELLKQFTEFQMARYGLASKPSLMVTIIGVEFAVGEEIIFRLGIQNFLARQFKLSGRKYGIAIVLAATMWSMAHANTLAPEWVKFAQVFPLGIALGYIFKRFGIEACILTHALFNIVMMLIGTNLIS